MTPDLNVNMGCAVFLVIQTTLNAFVGGEWTNVIAVNTGVTVRVRADRPCNYLATGQSAGCIGVGTRKWLVWNCSRDPTGQSEFFVHVSRLHLLNWLYFYIQPTISRPYYYYYISHHWSAAIAVFQLTTLCLVFFRLFTLKPFVNWNRDTGIQRMYGSHTGDTLSSTTTTVMVWEEWPSARKLPFVPCYLAWPVSHIHFYQLAYLGFFVRTICHKEEESD